MKKIKILKILGVIVLLIALHLYEYNQHTKKVYERSYEILNQQLRIARMYYAKHGQENRSELQQILNRNGHSNESNRYAYISR